VQIMLFISTILQKILVQTSFVMLNNFFKIKKKSLCHNIMEKDSLILP